jgi:hypothetical protein
MNRKLGLRIAAALLALHGLIEITGFILINSTSHTQISFGGLTGALVAQNTQTIGVFGALWGSTRLIAGLGIWSLRKWAVLLGIILSIVTMVAAIFIIPAGVADTILAIPVLVLLLYTWFGNETMKVNGG